MPKPKTKTDLLDLGKQNYEKLMAMVNAYPEEEVGKKFPPGTMNRNIRDILAHLHFWHVMMLDWYEIGMTGQKPDMPAKGYTWQTLPDLNRKIWQDAQEIGLSSIKSLLDKSFKDVRQLVQIHTDEELFEKKKYGWTGSTSLGAYLISNTSSHYDWAIKQIKKGMK